MLREADIERLLEPFGLALSPDQQRQIGSYLELLLHWNRRINLTAIRRPEECVTRHFGESLLLARYVELKGQLLDIGTGAGFPGLAVKISAPQLRVTLLEPSTKKRAFLKAVARNFNWEGVEVRQDRLEEFARQMPAEHFDIATARAVGSVGLLVRLGVTCLRRDGRLCLWLTRAQLKGALGGAPSIDWKEPVPIPLSQRREILIGVKSAK